MLSFHELWSKLSDGDESVMLEAKHSSQAGKSMWETISAFSNEPDAGGGYFLLGVARKRNSLFPDYEVIGVDDPDKLQSDLATQCREVFSSPVRPELSVETVDNDKCVVVVHIPEAVTHQKPVFIKSRGASKGSFRRIGPTDQVCTEDDLALFYQSRGSASFDENEIKGTTIEDVDLNALAQYRMSRSGSSTASDLLEMGDFELLYALNATVDRSKHSPLTLSGLLVFGLASSLRRYLPMTRVDYIRVEGTEWVKDTESRYQTIEKTGALLTIIPQLINQVLDDIPKAFNLPEEDVHRRDKPLIPKKVIREAIVNSLMHRSYRIHQPVQIIRFANRIEINNPGYSLIPDERLGEAGSRTRNPKIAATLHDAGLAETKGTGVKVMREAMTRANLTHPLIESDRVRDEFRLRLLVHHLLGESDLAWLSQFSSCRLTPDEARSLIVLREIGTIDNAAYRQINHMDSLVASSRLRRLRDLGLLEQVGKGASTKYKPGPVFYGSKRRKRNPATSAVQLLTDAQRQQLNTIRQQLSEDIRNDVDSLKKRADQAALDGLIVRICNVQPFNAVELGLLLGRNSEHIRNRIIRRLLSEGQLLLYYPNEPNHPNQRYISSDCM